MWFEQSFSSSLVTDLVPIEHSNLSICVWSLSDASFLFCADVGKSSLLLRFADNSFSGEFNLYPSTACRAFYGCGCNDNSSFLSCSEMSLCGVNQDIQWRECGYECVEVVYCPCCYISVAFSLVLWGWGRRCRTSVERGLLNLHGITFANIVIKSELWTSGEHRCPSKNIKVWYRPIVTYSRISDHKICQNIAVCGLVDVFRPSFFIQAATSRRSEWTLRSAPWISRGRESSCRSGTPPDRRDSEPSPPRNAHARVTST